MLSVPEYEELRQNKAKAQIQEVVGAYRSTTQKAETAFLEASDQTQQAYREAYDLNAIHEAVSLRNAKEAIANANAVNSGFESAWQTSIKRSHQAARTQMSQEKSTVLKNMMRELDTLRRQQNTQKEGSIQAIYAESERDIDQYRQMYKTMDGIVDDTDTQPSDTPQDSGTSVGYPTVDTEAIIRTADGVDDAVQKFVEEKANENEKANEKTIAKTILSPSQIEYYRAKAGDFRYENPKYDEAVELQKKLAQQYNWEDPFEMKTLEDAAAVSYQVSDSFQTLVEDVVADYGDGAWQETETADMHLGKLDEMMGLMSSAIRVFEENQMDDSSLLMLYRQKDNLSQMYSQLTGIKNTLSEYDSEEEYYTAMFREQQKTLDLEQAKEQLAQMEADLEKAEYSTWRYNETYALANEENESSYEVMLALKEKYGIEVDEERPWDIPNNVLQQLQTTTQHYRLYVRQSEYLQKSVQFTQEAQSDPDFEQKSRVDKRFFDQSKVYRKINDPEETNCGKYQHMEADEIDVYNYYFNTHGEEVAEEYLKSIEEDLNIREGRSVFENYLEDKLLREMLFGVWSGYERFGMGIYDLFNFTDDYIPKTVTQIASEEVREDLSEDSKLAMVAYDLCHTTANMAPSILASTLLALANPTAGAIAGVALMSTSSAGNAYSEALRKGYTKGQARAYSTMIGVSEGILQYVIGGIGKLGSAATKSLMLTVNGIENGIAKVAFQLGGKILAEGTEEMLQEVLKPLYENVALGVNINSFADIDWEQATYSFLLGALTGGLFEGGEVVHDAAVYVSVGKKVKESGGASALIDLALSFAEYSDVARYAKTLSSDPTSYQLGELTALIVQDARSGTLPMNIHLATAMSNEVISRAGATSDTVASSLPSAVDGVQTASVGTALAQETPTAADGVEIPSDTVDDTTGLTAEDERLFQAFKNALDSKVSRVIDRRRRRLSKTSYSDEELLAAFRAGLDHKRYVPSQSEAALRQKSDGEDPIGPSNDDEGFSVDNENTEVYTEDSNRVNDGASAQSGSDETVVNESVADTAAMQPNLRLKSRNDKLEGKRHPLTGVPFVTRVVEIDGEVYAVVVPQFDSVYDAQLPDALRYKSVSTQNKECSRQLYAACQNNPELRSRFTDEQFEQIRKGQKPDGYTWHHDVEVGRMQLVDRKIHKNTHHTGGQALWMRNNRPVRKHITGEGEKQDEDSMV